MRITKKEVSEAIEAHREVGRLNKIVKAARAKMETINLETGQALFVGLNPDDQVKLSIYPQSGYDANKFYHTLTKMGKSADFWRCVSVGKKKVEALDYLTPADRKAFTVDTGDISKVTWPKIQK